MDKHMKYLTLQKSSGLKIDNSSISDSASTALRLLQDHRPAISHVYLSVV